MEKKKILIIDDSKPLCQMMQAMLQENGPFEVRAESNPNLAIAAAGNYQPDLIILDILMPEVDGVTVAIHLRSDPILKDIPVMFLTAVAEQDDLIFGNKIAGYQVVTKDVSTEKLIEAINKNFDGTNPQQE